MNVGTALSVADAPSVNDPVVTTKLVLGVTVPLFKVSDDPFTVNVVHVSVPMLLNVPPVYVAVLEQVKLLVAKSTVPAVCVYVVQPRAPDIVTVPVLLTVNAAMVLPAVVTVPVPPMVAVSPVNVPPELNVRALRVRLVAGKVKAVVPKSILLKNPVVPIDCTAVPDPVNVKLTKLVLVTPAPVPKLNILVMSAAAVNPPVPV